MLEYISCCVAKPFHKKYSNVWPILERYLGVITPQYATGFEFPIKKVKVLSYLLEFDKEHKDVFIIHDGSLMSQPLRSKLSPHDDDSDLLEESFKL